jgi:outer membrane protein assembly factor BamB
MKISVNLFNSTALAIALAMGLLCRAGVLAGEAAAPGKGSDKAPLGSPDFRPSPEHPIGWRGDGTGCYPGANPPTVWFQKAGGESKNILWKTKLFCYSWSTPIIVGDKLFTLSDPYDLICLDKNTGKILWIRSLPPFIAVTDDEKKANPAFKDVDPLMVELQKVNDEFVAKGWTKEIYQKKYELQLKIDELTGKADKKYKLPPDQYVECWSGYTAPTPCSDGEFIYVTGGDGVTACFDLNGNRKWQIYESFTPIWGEHGFASSPAVAGDILLAPSLALRALNKKTGAEIYKLPFRASNSILTFKSNGIDFGISNGNYFRVKDGKVVVPHVGDMPSDVGMVLHNDMVYFLGGHVTFVKWQAKGADEIAIQPLITDEYNRVALPGGDSPKLKVDPSITGAQVGSPLYCDGLLYCLKCYGGLNVVDTTKTTNKDMVVYHSFPPFDHKNPQSRKTFGMGIGASPAHAGKYIYMIDSANCTLVLEPGREYKEVSKNSIDEIVPAQQSNTFGAKNYWMDQHQEQTESSMIFDGNRIYIRGEQNLYCISEEAAKH